MHVQSQQMAFTRSTLLSNNPKILTNCLIFTVHVILFVLRSKGKLFFYLNTVLCCDVLRLVRDWCSFNAGDVGDVPDVCQSIEMSVS